MKRKLLNSILRRFFYLRSGVIWKNFDKILSPDQRVGMLTVHQVRASRFTINSIIDIVKKIKYLIIDAFPKFRPCCNLILKMPYARVAPYREDKVF